MNDRWHFHNIEVKDFCAKWLCKRHIVAVYSLWVNGLVEGTKKILLHILKQLCALNLGEDKYDAMSWKMLPVNWPNHLNEVVTVLGCHILPTLKFSLKELLLEQIVNMPRTDITESTSVLRPTDVNVHIAYIGQQQLNGYDATICVMSACTMYTRQH
ncbi:hypothetical protein CY34DRAFT_95372 [Suillus luteus UH-Slu-Lm8-n1]|uniref:Integrase catalytic domain-containing protein n=1 Tax=Suillus luteus UH-Slu-Lm8-n1 TaxID=930992 RepID=A0A0C9ZEI5_9AGAM|nr:hypothetical protein CY34DRAFT_95372 [Suillus luteus UH-Slu-Lm8-n1]